VVIHLNRDGLDNGETVTFNEMLLRLNSKLDDYPTIFRVMTGNYSTLQLGNLRHIYEKFMERAWRESGMPGFFRPFVSRGSDHVLFLSELYRNGKKVIADPSGIAVNGAYVPYFGLLGHAPPAHAHAYERMEDVRNWGAAIRSPIKNPLRTYRELQKRSG